jgi:hypothetical protein
LNCGFVFKKQYQVGLVREIQTEKQTIVDEKFLKATRKIFAEFDPEKIILLDSHAYE